MTISLTLILKTSIDMNNTKEKSNSINGSSNINIKNLSKSKINKKLIQFKKPDIVKTKIRFFYS